MSPTDAANLVITLSAPGSEFVAGAELPLVVTLRNTAATGNVIVDSPQESSPFVFHVQPEQGPAFDLSQDRFQQETDKEIPPPRSRDVAPLRGGASLEYAVNLSAIMPRPVGPGVYRISVSYPLGGTALRAERPITVRIVPPRPQLLAWAPNGNLRRLGAAYVHSGVQGPVLYQRESAENRPRQGVFKSRGVIRGADSLALSIDAESTAEPRWIGWTEGGKASFFQVWDDALLHATETDALPAGSVLVSPGWTLSDQSAHFLAAATSGLTLISMPDRKKPRLRQYNQAPNAIPQPRMLRAGIYTEEGRKKRISVVWPAGGRLLHTVINPTGSATPPRVLIERAEPIVALDIQSVSRDGVPVVHALFAAPGAAKAHLVRVIPGQPPQTDEIALPTGHDHSPVRWEISAGEPFAIALQFGTERGVFWTSSTRAWRSLNPTAGGSVADLRLVRLKEVWATWLDVQQGLQTQNLGP